MTTTTLTALDGVAALAPIVAATATDADRAGRVADDVVAALHHHRLFRLSLPAHYGGLQLAMQEAFAVFEAAARLDGSVGWNLAVGATGLGIVTGRLGSEVATRILDDPRALIAGSVNPGAVRARPTDGGYVFNGKGTFASGSSHATWIMTAGITPDGTLRGGLVRPDSVTMIDSWHVSGLRATSSADFVLDNAFVPDELTFVIDLGPPPNAPLTVLPLASRLGVAFTFVALGIATHAVERFAELVTVRAPSGSTGCLAERVDVQIAVARARALIDAGRAYVLATWNRVEAMLTRGDELCIDDLAALRLSYVTATQNAIAATDAAWSAAGSIALYEGEPLERCWRDVHAAGQHAFVSPRHLDRIGRVRLGLPAGPGPV